MGSKGWAEASAVKSPCRDEGMGGGGGKGVEQRVGGGLSCEVHVVMGGGGLGAGGVRQGSKRGRGGWKQ